jgi:hypothetical protein
MPWLVWPVPTVRSSSTRTGRPPLQRQVPVAGRGSWEFTEQGEHLPDDPPVGRRVERLEALPLGHVRCSLRSGFAQPTHPRDRPGSAGHQAQPDRDVPMMTGRRPHAGA